MDCENNYNTYDEDIEVLFSVGRRFLTGNGLEKDEAKGKEMLTQAAMMGHSLAQQFLDRDTQYSLPTGEGWGEAKASGDWYMTPSFRWFKYLSPDTFKGYIMDSSAKASGAGGTTTGQLTPIADK